MNRTDVYQPFKIWTVVLLCHLLHGVIQYQIFTYDFINLAHRFITVPLWLLLIGVFAYVSFQQLHQIPLVQNWVRSMDRNQSILFPLGNFALLMCLPALITVGIHEYRLHTEGMIKEAYLSDCEMVSGDWKCTYRFEVDGHWYESKNVNIREDLGEGDLIEVIYVPSNPWINDVWRD